MKVKDLVELLWAYDNDDEIEIEIYETGSGKYIDTTAAISVVEEDVCVFLPFVSMSRQASLSYFFNPASSGHDWI